MAFAKKHRVACRIYHNVVKHGNELDCWIPENSTSHTPNMNWFVADDHCFWYGKPMEERGLSKASDANKGISQMWSKASSQSQQPEHPDEDDEEFDMQGYIQQSCDQETVAFFKVITRHLLSEWQCAWDLLHAAPEFTDYRITPR